MDSNEQQMIRSLFGRIGEAERSAPPRDPEAEQFIRRSVESQPAAPYYMAQTMIVQEEALKAANARIQELEAQVRERPSGSSGGFLGGLFGGGSSSRETARPQDSYAQQPGYGQQQGYGQPSRGGPWGGAQQAAPYGGAPGGYGAPMGGGGMMGGRGGGGFLAGAAQTAVGVAGGVMLGSMLGNLFTGDHPFGGGEQVTENITNETVNETVNNEGVEPAVDSGGDYDRAAYEDGGVQDASYDDYDAGGDFEEI